MKKLKGIISLLLAIFILGAVLVGCAKTEPTGNETQANNNSVDTTEEVTDFPFNIPKQDNRDKDGNPKKFNILYTEWALVENYYLYDPDKRAGELINDANFERQNAVNDYLGIEIVGVKGGDIFQTADKVQTATLSGEDSYGIALTHCYAGLSNLALGQYLIDFGSIECINLDADYWRGDSMKSVAVNGKQYLGTGSFILYDPAVLLFNKTMMDNYGGEEFDSNTPYENVRNKMWTLDVMMGYASKVSTVENENVAEGEGTYGFAIELDWMLAGFMASGNHFTLQSNGQGGYVPTPHTQAVDDLYLKVKDLVDAEYTYGWDYSLDTHNKIVKLMDKGKTMFVTTSLSTCIDTIANSAVKLGILPYPSMNPGQEIKQLDWAGFMIIPKSVKNVELSGAVAELLCYYGDKLVYPAFYDELLGLRSADNMQDAEMLDVIFDSLVTDPGLTYVKIDQDMYDMFYMFPILIKEGSTLVSSHFARYTPSLEVLLDFSAY